MRECRLGGAPPPAVESPGTQIEVGRGSLRHRVMVFLLLNVGVLEGQVSKGELDMVGRVVVPGLLVLTLL